MKQYSLLLLVLVFSASGTLARDIFVDSSAGDDAFCGELTVATTNINGPVRTISRALELVRAGDRIVLAAGPVPYQECVTLQGQRHSGYPFKPLIIDGNSAFLDGSVPVPDDAWQFVAGDVFRFQPMRMAYQQLFLDGKPVTRRLGPLTGERSELGPMEWCLHQGWIYFRGEAKQIPQRYALRYAGLQTGITLYKVHDVVINNLIVQGFQQDGINAHDGVRDTRLLSITARGNGRSGVCVAGGSRVEIAGSTLGDNGAAQLLLEEYSLTRVYDSLLIPNTGPAIVRSDFARLYLDGKLQTAKDEVLGLPQ